VSGARDAVSAERAAVDGERSAVGGVRGISILGATGSIGTSALRVIARHRERFEVVALTAHRNTDQLANLDAQWNASYVGIVESNGKPVPDSWGRGVPCLVEAATRPDADIVLNAVVGAAGLDATLAALGAGKRVALANKESLVMAGALVNARAAVSGGEIVPVDSEHSAILQCLAGRDAREVRRLVITASGGPFREWTSERLAAATLADALKHPTWSMGRKITVDSATLANKALEVIEAHFLFGVPYDAIEIVVHPQSVVHSMVEFIDGSVVAQLGVPSMELPILYSFTHPNRVLDQGIPAYDPRRFSPLTFEPVRFDDFPALRLGIEAGRQGGAAPAVFNAANEAAVARFLDGTLGFPEIAGAIGRALDSLGDLPGSTRDELIEADRRARELVSKASGD
jgi:1-deoxy-D-xylulose-5-phosphate reductoisomerase